MGTIHPAGSVAHLQSLHEPAAARCEARPARPGQHVGCRHKVPGCQIADYVRCGEGSALLIALRHGYGVLRISQIVSVKSAAIAPSPLAAEKESRPMIAPGSPTVRRRRLAAELREIRESKGKSGEAVAKVLKWSPSKISRYERAKTGLRPQEVERLLDYYQITGQRRELLLALAEDATQKGWWEEFADILSEDYRQFIGLEYEARSINVWHVEFVPGLL